MHSAPALLGRQAAVIMLLVFAGCGGGGGSSEEINSSGTWDAVVALSANGCPNDVPIIEVLRYVHSVAASPNPGQYDAVTVVDEQDEVFRSGSTAPTENSFIVTGSTHALNPFVNGADCRETIVWSYFNIADSDGQMFSSDVGRNSLIACTGPDGTIECNVYYSGTAYRRGGV